MAITFYGYPPDTTAPEKAADLNSLSVYQHRVHMLRNRAKPCVPWCLHSGGASSAACIDRRTLAIKSSRSSKRMPLVLTGG